MLTSYLARKAYLFGLVAAIFIVAAAGLLSYRDWREYEGNARSAAEARGRIRNTEELLSLLKDAETGQRGYLLTGDEAYLAPYQESLPRIQETLEALRRTAFPAGLAADKLRELARTIEMRRRGDVEGAVARVRSGLGKQIMDQIRAAAAGLVQSEEQQLSVRESLVRGRAETARIAILAGTAALALLLLLSTMSVHRLVTALDRQRATLETTLLSIGDAVISTDARGVVTFLNPIAESLTGWRARDAMGQPLATVFRAVGEATREPRDDLAAKVLAAGVATGLTNHTLLLAGDGREIPIDDSCAPVRDAHGRVAGVVLVFRDIAQRRRSQRELEDSERRYRLLFDNNPQPMWVFAVDTLAFLAVNNAAIQNYGYTREEFLSRTVKDIRPEEDIPALLEDVRTSPNALHTGGPWRHRKKDGAIITVEIACHPIEFDGRNARLILSTDITERKKLEEQFHQAQRLESVGRLAGGVAHDFNNLLTVIKGYTEMAISDLPPGDPLQESLNEIRSASDRAAALTQQLLAFSRKQLIQPAVLNLNRIIGEVEKMLRRLIGEDIELVAKLAPDLGNVKADSGQIQQMLLNLAVNARDAMPEGGSLLIETSNVMLDEGYAAAHPAVQPGPYVMIAVTDTGIGMTPEVQARIFEPFFTTKPKGAGTGLGLATVYGMVRQSGGWIWVYSEPGCGATFKIYLPWSGEQAPHIRPAVKMEVHGSETVLVVEDQAEVRTLAVAALKRFGYEVLSAAGGPEALAVSRAFSGRIHLLVTDVVMPGMNGRDLAEQLIGERSGLEVLYMSGYTDTAIAHHRVLNAGVAYIQKPFTPERLAGKVREALGTAHAKGTILLVDDDDALRRLLHGMLTDAGYEVWEAADGRQAIARVGRQPQPDLVLTDLVMPEQEGIELIRQLHAQHPALKIIAMSGAFDGDFLRIASALGAAATLRKPIGREELLRTVESVLADRGSSTDSQPAM